MLKNRSYPVLALIICSLAVPGVRAEPCYNTSDMVCVVYQVCRYVLDKFPEAEINEKGKDCILTIEGRQLIIRRKKVGSGIKYFVFAKAVAAKERSRPVKFRAGAKNPAKKSAGAGEARLQLRTVPAFRAFGIARADVVDPNGQLVRLDQ
ncbi:MAG: hypothetical protein NTX59_14370 [Elusimicrobia bacterium]|nr:hypothetical protein [Elusimicrobiota bacterium]